MATAVQKITLSASRDIPFNKLALSRANVRRVKAGVSIEELAEDIARRTLLQGLSVRAVLNADGHETGMFEVPAGGRRFRASARSRPPSRRSRIGRSGSIPPTSPAPASSSASIATAHCASSAVSSDPRMKRRSSRFRPRLTKCRSRRARGFPSSALSSPSAAPSVPMKMRHLPPGSLALRAPKDYPFHAHASPAD